MKPGDSVMILPSGMVANVSRIVTFDLVRNAAVAGDAITLVLDRQVDVARGDMIDDDALIAALKDKTIAGAFLDPTNPEPLPADAPLWDAPNAIITMHLSGRSQTRMFQRAATLFLKNLAAFRDGAPMENVADLQAGY